MRRGSQWQFRIAACLVALLVFGCQSSNEVYTWDAPRVSPSIYKQLGTISQVDPGSATVVVKLLKDHPEITETLYVRNRRLEVVAILKPTGIRTGSSVGMVIVQGDPQVGQEVAKKTPTNPEPFTAKKLKYEFPA